MPYYSKHTGAQVDGAVDKIYGLIDGSLAEAEKKAIGANIDLADNAELTAELTRLAETYAFGGVVTPSTNPGTPEVNTFYLANEAGVYANMGGVELKASEFAFIAWDGSSWTKQTAFDYQSLPIANGSNPFDLISVVIEDGRLKQAALAQMLPYLEYDVAYGIEWDVTISSPACTRIGNMSLHRSLPVQTRMKGCLLDDEGNVIEYLPVADWTGAMLDGSNGQVMVEIPMHYRKFETIGNIRRCWVSEYPVSGYHKVPKMYISAYEATVQRSTYKLSSVVNADEDYRGGNNNAEWDGTYRSLLGRPASGINRAKFREYARNRNGGATAEWNCQDYNAYKAIFWLYFVEYANRDAQLAVNAQKDANGCTQGGLGIGVTNMVRWNDFNSTNPFVPCGHTNELGNGSGEVAYDVMQADGSVLVTVYPNRYRGVENLFGHLYKHTDAINIQINPTTANGGDDTSKIYVADNPATYNDNNYDDYSFRGLMNRSNGYVKDIIFGELGDIVTASIGGGDTLYWADSMLTSIPTATALRCVLFGGDATFGRGAGLSFTSSIYGYTAGSGGIGSRLCFIPETEE